jgi:hypothetical protein
VLSEVGCPADAQLALRGLTQNRSLGRGCIGRSPENAVGWRRAEALSPVWLRRAPQAEIFFAVAPPERELLHVEAFYPGAKVKQQQPE